MPLSFESATLSSWLLFVILQAVDEGNMQMISVQKEESQDAGCRCATTFFRILSSASSISDAS